MFKDALTARLMKLHFNAPPEDGTPGEGGGTTPATETGTPPAEGGKTFTQEELDRIINQRLGRERKTWETQVEEERKKATMTAEEKLKADLEAERLKTKAAEDRVTAAERRAALTGKVVNADAALKLMDPDKHLDAEGNLNVDALLKDHPYLAPTTQSAGATAPNGGGGTQQTGKVDFSTMSDKEFAEYQARVARGERIIVP
ncbi:capsid assembly scaffolding protein Gp46 family protein [Deinococcus peraridilitoris]|uniref:Uncharacterized protein n=1 Tax=Deinococcus peraridilitoris (strain DSM 19664 / LMG 22246 / CIP 109416 / KR-200) TaxID=937777 RepID=K9ZZ96_DEIPD|nr:DUF4355 domain-containing protein [Deinococcus peraridilitoris]AFZ66075.1 hypothetical protein Deipe_0479 [Deinococcus peraridilitoris DSM 19664]